MKKVTVNGMEEREEAVEGRGKEERKSKKETKKEKGKMNYAKD